MEKRTEIILSTVIKEHIKTGAPVGSGVLVDKYKLDISPATVRNEMARLEENGFICQPHTSAGRIPTEIAYNFYVRNLKDKKLKDKDLDILEKALVDGDEQSFKQTAKIMSDMSGNAIFWAFHRHNLYYTGISNLFQQPEFARNNLIYDISSIIDRLDEIIDEVFDSVKTEAQVMIGSKNPFGNFCSTVLIKYKNGDNTGLVGILSPMRTDYKKNLALINYVFGKVNK